MTLTLYTNPMSRGRIARWMLEEVGHPYTAVILAYGPDLQTPGFLAVNPMGKVPCLRHDEQVITECAAICTYLAEAFPAAGLFASDRAAFHRWMFFAAGPLEQAVTNKALGLSPPADRETMVGYGNFDRTVAALETALHDRPYIAGPRFSAADVYVGSQIGWGLQFGTLPPLPAFTAYWDRLRSRPALIRANAADDALIPKETP